MTWAFVAAVGCLLLASVWWPLAWVALPVTAYLLLRLAARTRRRFSVLALAAAVAAAGSLGLPPSRGTGAVLPFALVLAAAWAVGVGIARQQEKASRALVERARAADAAADRARADLAEERLRIARDLHDVVAHHLTVITVQAGYGALVGSTDPDASTAALEAVAQTGRTALDELRSMVGVLRADGSPDAAGVDSAPLRPAPGLSDLADLVSQAARAGLTVELVEVDLRRATRGGGVRPGVELAAYRIVQEGLTNVVRHARTDRAEVTVRRDDAGLVVSVSDAGRGPRPGAAPGNGLSGVAERAAALGGTVHAGPRPGTGYLLEAILPLAPVPALPA